MCWDANLTITNETNVTRTRVAVWVRFETPQTDFPEVDEWYDGIEGTARQVGTDGRLWLVEFEVEIAPGKSAHVGWDFEESIEFGTGGPQWMAALPPSELTPQYGALALTLRRTSSRTVLVAENPSTSPASIIVHSVRVAVSDHRLPLNNLIGGDKTLAALTWRDTGAKLPVELQPGQRAVEFDIPLDDLSGKSAFVAVTKISDPDEQMQIETFCQGPVDVLVPGDMKRRAMDERKEQRKQSTPRQRAKKECSGLRIVLLLGRDEAIEGGAAWALRRARALGGNFQLWHTSESDPFNSSVRVMNAREEQQRKWEKYERDPGQSEKGYDDLLAGYPEGCTRIDELVVIHHGNRVEENDVIAGLLEILVHEKRVPICKLVYWACNAAVDLDVSEGHWMDILMKAMGGISREQDDCPCPGPVELVWPTPGRCYLDPFEGDRLETNDGNVNRMRWGYRHQDGQLHREPDPNNPQPTRSPGDREWARGRGTVLGTPVGRH